MGGVRRAPVVWTPEMIERLLESRRKGVTIRRIAAEMDLSHGSVGRQLERLGQVNPRMARAERLSAFAELLAEGFGVCQAARELGFDPRHGSKLFKALCAEVGEQAR